MMRGFVETLRSMPSIARYHALLRQTGETGLDAVPTHLTRSERLMLYRLAKESRGDALEIGSYVGASAAFIALGIRERGDGVVFCVDTWENDAMSEGRRDTFAEFTRNTSTVSRHVRAIRGRSEEVAEAFTGTIGLLFIDGDHSYRGVMTDVDAWLPRLHAGGVVVMHDIGWAEGVQRAARERVIPRAARVERLPNMLWAWIG